MEEYLKNLGINKPGEMNSEGTYVVALANSAEFSKIYSILDKNTDLQELDDSSTLTVENSNIVFIDSNDDNYLINLIADFDADTYKLTITEV